MSSGLKWFQIVGGMVIGFTVCWLLHLVLMDRLEDKHRTALDDQRASLEKSCADDKAKTERANNALQQEYSLIAHKLHESERMRPARCIVPVAKPPIAPAGGGEPAGQNGISTTWLRSFAAECERYRAERMILERFMDEVWSHSR